jgi:hypothetical protein
MAEIYGRIHPLTPFVDYQHLPWYCLVIQQRAFVQYMSMCAAILQCAAIGDLNDSTKQMLADITAK